jgi:hypothetical protein
VNERDLQRERNARTFHHINAIQRLQDCRVFAVLGVKDQVPFILAHPRIDVEALKDVLAFFVCETLEESNLDASE